MSAILPLLMIVILAACIGVLFYEGLWSNVVRLVNVVTSGLVAMNFFEPLARWIETWGEFFESATYFWDFISLWVLFGLSMIVLRLATDSISRVKVRFLKVADRAGSAILAIIIGWVMVCFVMATLHAAPLCPNFLFGGFDPSRRMLMVGPDRQWLGFVQHVSKGPFARSEKVVFDENNQFMVKYNNRRGSLEKMRTEKNSLRAASGDAPKR
jgi:uncharacterized membrane protein required for colicin V production